MARVDAVRASTIRMCGEIKKDDNNKQPISIIENGLSDKNEHLLLLCNVFLKSQSIYSKIRLLVAAIDLKRKKSKSGLVVWRNR